MILVDSSVWVDFFSRSPGPGGQELRRLIHDNEPIALTGVVVTELLQGLTGDVTVIEHFMSQWDILEPTGFDTYRVAASIYRAARGKGVTLTTRDALIASVATAHEATVFTLDRDFSRLAPIAGLALHRF